ncbi:hypothetical protein ksw1_26960 [Staphylococcus aureus]|nr:hypothetical protein ksw1_26960 [Staphylococcus aureus]
MKKEFAEKEDAGFGSGWAGGVVKKGKGERGSRVNKDKKLTEGKRPISVSYTQLTLPTTIRMKCPHKADRMEMKTAISCTILRNTKIMIAVGG